MYITATRIAWVCAGLVLFGSHWLFMSFIQTDPQDFERQVAELEGRAYWDAEDAEAAARTFQQGVRATRRALEGHQYEVAAETFNAAAGEFEKWAYEHGRQRLANGQTLYTVYDEGQMAVAEALRAELPYLIEQMKRGALSRDDESRLFNGLHTAYTATVKSEYDAYRPEIEAARVERSRQWLRINVNGNLHGKHPRILAMLEQKLRLPQGITVVNGYSFGQAERRNTWKSLELNLVAHHALYEFDESNQHRGSASLPERLELTFRMRTGEGAEARSNWDQLPTLTVSVELPETFNFSFDNDRQMADLSEQQAKFEEELMVKLAQALETLPDFQVETDSIVDAR